jgi:hypothetical protein
MHSVEMLYQKRTVKAERLSENKSSMRNNSFIPFLAQNSHQICSRTWMKVFLVVINLASKTYRANETRVALIALNDAAVGSSDDVI